MRTTCASLILHNGNVHTMNRHHPRAQAVAALGELIVAVGSDDEVRALADTSTRVIDLRGSTVLPGFVDAHTHMLDYGLSLDEIDLREAESLAQAVEMVKSAVEGRIPGEWATGRGWNRNRWPEGRLPCADDLDSSSSHNPVALWSKDFHTLWVNSLALERAGITESTGNPAGGYIEKDPVSGEPTGILRESAAELLWHSVGEPTQERLVEALRKASSAANRLGLVGVHACEGPQSFRTFQSLRRRGDLSLRVHMMLSRDAFPHAVEVGLKTGFGDGWISVGPVKLFADGSLGSQTAAMLGPYESSTENLGILVTGREELMEIVAAASHAGISSAIHAIGDAACRHALDAIEAARPSRGGTGKCSVLRQRLEHVQLVQAEDIRRIAHLGVVASVQPVHATSDRDLADSYWGARCAGRAYAYRTLLESGVRLAFGSDAPVESLDPLQGIYAAVTRKRAAEPDRPAWYPEERLTVFEAVHGYTLGAAYASGEERLKGSIETGKLADLVVLSREIFAIPTEEILQMRVEDTIVGGKVVYEAD